MNPPWRRLVVCLDFSPEADQAFAQALALAQEDARLTLLHVIPPGPLVLPGQKPLRKHLNGAERGQLVRAYLEERYLSRCDPRRTELVLRQGHPSVEILQHLTQNPTDLVLLGAQGLSGMGLIIFGSVSDRVMRGAPCSCLLVRLADQAPPEAAEA